MLEFLEIAKGLGAVNVGGEIGESFGRFTTGNIKGGRVFSADETFCSG